MFGNIDLRSIERAAGITFDNEDVETITGLVYEALGVIPKDGAQDLDLKVGGLDVHISKIEEHQIVHSRIRLLEMDISEGTDAS